MHLSINPDWKTRQPVTEESTAPVRAKPFDKNVGCWFLKHTFAKLLTSHEVKEARPAAEDGDEDDEESRDLGHHLQLVPRGV